MEIINKIKNLDTKIKVLGVVGILLFFMIIIALAGNNRNSNYNENYYQDDSFGNGEEITAIQKEDVVATTPDIEVVVLSKKFGGGRYGYIEITKATASVDATSIGDVLINVEGIKGAPGDYKNYNPPIEYRVYDANDTLLWSNNVYVDNYDNKEQGDICKGSAHTHLKPEQVARIEIG